MTLPENLNVYISAAVFVLGAYLFALYVGLIVWTVRDIRRRSRDVMAQIMAVLLVALFTLPGLLVYVLLRPQSTLAEEYERSLAEESLLQDLDEKRVCPSCRRRVEPDFVVCPHCHQQLRLRCVGCGKLLNPDWDVCPYCGLYREQEDEKAAKGRRREAARSQQAAALSKAAPVGASTAASGSAEAEEQAEVVRIEEMLRVEADEEPAGELPDIDVDEVTRRLDELSANAAMARGADTPDEGDSRETSV